MQVRELIDRLSDLPGDMEVMRPGGEDPKANLVITHIEVCETYNRDGFVAVVRTGEKVHADKGREAGRKSAESVPIDHGREVST